ncbi:hypothetical protein [Dactylosporangium sp. CA-233914]|uniref:hypothetical protein n=1 Tax=Dactylosporangium sp. CA-233914 TaxID=3239934 RepID=UPI003D8B710C
MTTATSRLHVIAYDGGVQSTALTVRNRPLRTLDAAQDPLPGFEPDGDGGPCDNGACFT